MVGVFICFHWNTTHKHCQMWPFGHPLALWKITFPCYCVTLLEGSRRLLPKKSGIMDDHGQPNWVMAAPRYIRQFFPLDAVLEGLFHLLGELFDVEVRRPRWFRWWYEWGQPSMVGWFGKITLENGWFRCTRVCPFQETSTWTWSDLYISTSSLCSGSSIRPSYLSSFSGAETTRVGHQRVA